MALSKPTGKLAFAYQSIVILEAARKQDEALIRQLVGALEAAVLQNDCDMAMTGEELRQSRSAITLGCARLEGKPCD